MATEPKAADHAARDKAAADRLNEDKKRVTQEREERAKQMAEREKNRGTPTPTQEECDLLKLGHHPELAADGSGPDPTEKLNTVRHIGAKEKEKNEKPAAGADYSTRQATAKA